MKRIARTNAWPVLLSVLLALTLVVTGCAGTTADVTSGSASGNEKASSGSSAIATTDDDDSAGESSTATTAEAMPDDFDLAVEDVPELVPDVLGIRDLEFEDMPTFETQDEVAEYILWNLLWGRMSFEFRVSRDLSDGENAYVLNQAYIAAKGYFLFGAYTEWDMYTEDDGEADSVYAKITLKPEENTESYDLEARAEALEYVMKNPVPDGGFTSYEEEMEYARGIHDYIACKVTYDPMGFDPYNLLNNSSYDSLQEAYNALAEDQNSVVCAGYAHAFALICHCAGINCAYVYGNDTGTTSHAWNVIYPCDGSDPVVVDVTWDDTSSDDAEGQTEVVYDYFYVLASEDYSHEADASEASFLEYLNGK